MISSYVMFLTRYAPAAVLQSVLTQKEAKFNSTDLNIAYKMPVAEYQQLCEYSEALEENWGKPPGNLNSNGQELLVYGKQFGNVFIGVQPTFGYEGDPMRLLFSRSASPHHGFAAYYTFLEKIFKADAVLHFGTHGSLEFMPGKQVSGGFVVAAAIMESHPHIQQSLQFPAASPPLEYHPLLLNVQTPWQHQHQHNGPKGVVFPMPEPTVHQCLASAESHGETSIWCPCCVGGYVWSVLP